MRVVNNSIKYIKSFLYCSLFGIWLLFYWKQCVINNSGDYYWHNQFAQWIVNGEMTSTYPGYHLIVGDISKITGINILIVSAFILALMAIISIYITSCLIDTLSDNKNKYYVNIVLALIVNFVQPIFTAGNRPGYCSGNGYISPTQAMCKPFILLAIFLFYKNYQTNNWGLFSSIKLLLCLLITCVIKPVFAMAFIPSMGLLLFIEELKEKKDFRIFIKKFIIKVWSLFIVGVFLICQYMGIFVKHIPNSKYKTVYQAANPNLGNPKICFGFLYSWKMVVSNVWLSIFFAYFFPIVLFITLIIIRKKLKGNIIKDYQLPFIKMTVAYAIVSFIYMAFLYQDAGYERDCNFRNAWVITFLMVFLFCVILLYKLMIYFSFKEELKNISNNGLKTFFKNSYIIILPSTALLIHIVFGILLFAKNLLF